VGGVVACVVGDLLEPRQGTLRAVDGSIVVIPSALEALQPGFLGDHDNQGSQPAQQTGRG